MRAVLTLLVFSSLLICAPKEFRWNKAVSPNFIIYSIESEKEATRTALQFEQVRANLEAIGLHAPVKRPVMVFSFGGNREFERIAFRKGLAAFYLGATDQDYIVMRDVNPETFPVAIHEYVHLLVKYSDLDPPVWLNEGLAEFYSTLKGHKKDQVLVGDLPPTHLMTLNTNAMIPLPQLLGASHSSPLYNEDNRANIFYAQSWALTHMLLRHQGYGARSQGLFARMAERELTPQDFEEVFGRSLQTIEKDLRQYVTLKSYSGALFPSKLEKVEAQITSGPVEAAEARLNLACMTAATREYEEAVPVLERLLAENPANPRIHEQLALVALRRKNNEDRIKHLAEADRLGSTNPEMMIRYTYDLSRETEADREKVMMTLIRVQSANPDHVDARIQLAYSLISNKKALQAYVLLSQVKNVTPKQAFEIFYARSYAQMGLNDFAKARGEAEHARKFARDDNQKQRIDKTFEQLEQRARYEEQRKQYEAKRAEYEERMRNMADNRPSPAVPPSSPDDPGGMSDEGTVRPTLQRLPSARGYFTDFDCSGKTPVLRIRAGSDVLGFDFDSPQSVLLEGAGSATMDLNCGAQSKPRLVTVFYVAEKNAALKSQGHVRRIKFEE